MTGRWGKAGVRLTPEQVRARAGRILLRRQQGAEYRARSLAIAKQKWAAGLVVPHMITLALDARDLYGPEVDVACRAKEPEVDLWEAGKLYPQWDQLVALAELTGNTPNWFTEAGSGALSAFHTSMRFHVRDLGPADIPILRYPDSVVARCPGTGLPGAQCDLFTTTPGDDA